MAYGDDPDIGQLIETLPAGGFRNLLQAGWQFESEGASRTAAAVYRTALQAIPQFLPSAAGTVLGHAKAVVEANDRALEAFLGDRLGELRARHGNSRLDRFDKCLDTLLRKRRVYRPSPSFLYFPELPPIEFHDRADFPWLDALEAAADDIRAELIDVLADGPEVLQPYMAEKSPQARWRELNNSRRWGVYYLWRAGAPDEANLARCPKTAAALEAWPKCDLLRTGPTAVFSILEARTRIPPHVGVNNARLIVHLPLVVPPGCGFRVGSRATKLGARQGLRLRRHHRTRGLERQRRAPRRADPRHLEPARDAGGT